MSALTGCANLIKYQYYRRRKEQMYSFIDYQRVQRPGTSKYSDQKTQKTDTKFSQGQAKSCLRKPWHVRNPSSQERSFQNDKQIRTIRFDLPETSSTHCLNAHFRKSCSRLFFSNVIEQFSRTRRTKSKAQINQFPHAGQITAKTKDLSFLNERKSTTGRSNKKIDFDIQIVQSSVNAGPQPLPISLGVNSQKEGQKFFAHQNKQNWESQSQSRIFSIDEQKRKFKNSSSSQNYLKKYLNDNIPQTTIVSKLSEKTLTRQMGGLHGGYDNKNISQDLKTKESKKQFESLQKISVKFDKSQKQKVNKKPSINDFHIGQCKGEGKFGKIYFAIHKESGFICALKKIKKESVRHILDQFVQEVKIQIFLNHPKLVKMYGYFSDHEHFYMIVQYMEQGSLYSLMKRNKKFSQKEAKQKVRQICLGIQQMHENNIVHRDLKPENVVLTHVPKFLAQGVCKVCDFGWATLCQDRRKTYCGTLDYVCPEIAEGESYDSGVDVWCIGILAYELMCGKAPFYDISRKKTIEKIKNAKVESFPTFLSQNAIRFIEMILQKNPEDRFGVNELLNSDFLKQVKTDFA